MASLAILTMFKNESDGILEWITHHKLEGISEFFLLDNGSTDDSPEIAKKMGCTVVSHPEKHSQEKYLSLYGSRGKNKQPDIKADWIMAIDVDEFVYARNGYDKITDYLSTLSQNIDAVRLTFKMFGSSNDITQPGSIISSYTLRAEDNQAMPPPQHWNYKTIYRNKKSDVPRVVYAHAPEPLGTTIFPIKKDDENPTHAYASNGRQYCDRALKFKEEEKFLNLNHYAVQSKENYYFIRCRKGDVNMAIWEKRGLRNYEFFKQRDFRETTDEELKKKRGGEWSENFKKPKTHLDQPIAPDPDKINVFCYWDEGLAKMPKMLQNIAFHNKMICDENEMIFHLITDNNIANYIKIFKDFYNLAPNHKSDYARWFLLEEFGGAWIDCDVVLLKSLSPIWQQMDKADLAINTEISLSCSERSFETGYPKQILRFADYKELSGTTPYFKIGCCFMVGKKGSEIFAKGLALVKRAIKENIREIRETPGSYHKPCWPDLGPIVCSELFEEFHDSIKLIDGGREDKSGFHAVTWKVDKLKKPEAINYPGHDKSQWIGDPHDWSKKAKKILNNPQCFCLPSWSIYRENDIEGDVCDFVLKNSESLYSHLVK